MAPSRSRMFTKPCPCPSYRGIEAGAVVAHEKSSSGSDGPGDSTLTLTVTSAPSPACLPAFCMASRQQK